MTDVVVVRRIMARPETIFSFFTDPQRWLQWQGVDAVVEARPGGVFRINVTGDGYASGRFVEVDPPRRIVFTWGWEVPDLRVPPGSSTVEISLEPEDGVTVVQLIHRDLPEHAIEPHRTGWEHYVERLSVVVTGIDPGPDPMRRDRGARHE